MTALSALGSPNVQLRCSGDLFYNPHPHPHPNPRVVQHASEAFIDLISANTVVQMLAAKTGGVVICQ